jgi:septal ring factor EnvC (AmiA/AmiB activator)
MFQGVLLLPIKTSLTAAILAEMSVNGFRQLVQFKLAMECMRAEHNLLFVVGHANLLRSLADLGDDQIKRLERELASSKEKVEVQGAHSEQLYTMSKKLGSDSAWTSHQLILTRSAKR